MLEYNINLLFLKQAFIKLFIDICETSGTTHVSQNKSYSPFDGTQGLPLSSPPPPPPNYGAVSTPPRSSHAGLFLQNIF